MHDRVEEDVTSLSRDLADARWQIIILPFSILLADGIITIHVCYAPHYKKFVTNF